MWNLRLGAVYGPDRRPCPLWPLVELFSEDVENKIAELLAPQPRLPTPQYRMQLKHPYPKYVPWPPILHPCSQWQDAVNRFINNYWDSPQLAAYRLRYPHNPPMVFVDWDDKGRLKIFGVRLSLGLSFPNGALCALQLSVGISVATPSPVYRSSSVARPLPQLISYVLPMP